MQKGVATVAQLSGFDEIIDARTPAEFAEDHIPGAINLPVLDNDERRESETTSALYDFGDAIDVHQLVDEFVVTLALATTPAFAAAE